MGQKYMVAILVACYGFGGAASGASHKKPNVAVSAPVRPWWFTGSHDTDVTGLTARGKTNYIRSAPNRHAQILEKVPDGSQLVYMDSELNGYVKTATSKGRLGWIAQSHVSYSCSF